MDSKVSALDTIPAIDRAADLLYIVDSSAGTPNKVTPNTLLGITGNPVGTTDTQTLTNKTMTSPTISGPTLSGTITGTYTLGGTPTFPAAVVTLTGTQTLTNKTLTSPTINTATISNPTLTVDSVAEYTSANGVTIDGLNIKDGKLNTNNSVVTNNITNGAILPNHLKAGVSSNNNHAWDDWTPSWTNLTVGNGTLNYAKYIRIGDFVSFRLKFTLGTTSAMGTAPTFSLPVTAAYSGSDEEHGVHGLAVKPGSNNYVLHGWFSTTTTCLLRPYVVSGSSVNVNTDITSTIPFTWGASDIITVTGNYQAAV